MSTKGVRDRRRIFYSVTLVFIILIGLVALLRLPLYLFLASMVLYLLFIVVAVFAQNTALFVPIFLPDPSVGRVVALTFDDGPHPDNTPKVLRILQTYRTKATFFFVGRNVEKYPELVIEIDRAGHQIANHTFNHPSLINFYSKKRLKKEMLKGQESIYSVIHKRPKFFRQVAGIVNIQLGKFVDNLGLVLVGWDVSPGDIRERRPDRIIKRVVGGVRNGSIILMHDGAEPWVAGREAIISETLPAIIEGIKNRGFGFATVEELYKRHVDHCDL
jgi:peptidoglycan/xylan/chitin deacetylase (PgdA/CDA1 family)